ncbi:hypothetical protein K439DRAFT_1561605 [Ramaria rubella]|nr:hypothetical protein K439DRAFT_1561605 [Ramaria rubella]
MLSFDSEAMLPLLLVQRLKHQYVAEARIHHIVKLPTPACLRGALLVLYKVMIPERDGCSWAMFGVHMGPPTSFATQTSSERIQHGTGLGHSHNGVTIRDGNGPEVASEQGLQFFDKPWKDSQFGGVEISLFPNSSKTLKHVTISEC